MAMVVVIKTPESKKVKNQQPTSRIKPTCEFVYISCRILHVPMFSMDVASLYSKAVKSVNIVFVSTYYYRLSTPNMCIDLN